MEMLNERAIRIIEEIPIETDEQKAALLYGMQNQCPELLGECVDYLEALDEKNPSFTIWDYKRSK